VKDRLKDEVLKKGLILDVEDFTSILNRVNSLPDGYSRGKRFFGKDDIDRLKSDALSLKMLLLAAFEKKNCRTNIKRVFTPYDVSMEDFINSLRSE